MGRAMADSRSCTCQYRRAYSSCAEDARDAGGWLSFAKGTKTTKPMRVFV